jgi:hypothetical protein
MVAIAFCVLLLMGLVSNSLYSAMRIRLIRMDSARDRIEWLSLRSSDAVLETYETLFPKSLLPPFCRLTFWTFILCGAVGLCAVVLLKTLGR